MKKIFFTILLLSAILPAFAFRIEYGGSLVISEPVYEDLYIAGGSVTVNAPVYGDLVIAGGTIVINDTVTNDILLAGGTVTFNGFAGDDIRCAGGTVHITRNVNGDVVVLGGRVTVDKGVTIGGMLAAGGTITIDGSIKGNLMGTFGDLYINGSVSGDVHCRGGSITIDGPISGSSVLAASAIILKPKASFQNDIRYWSEQRSPDFRPYMKSGKATFDSSLRILSSKWYYLGYTSLLLLIWYLGMAMLMIFIVQYLFSSTMRKAAATVLNQTLKSMGIGLLFFIAVPVIAVLAFITTVGVPVGLLLVFSYIGLVLLATVICSVVAANWINNRRDQPWNNWRLGFAALGFFILFKLLSLTPVFGWLIMILIVCLSFGGILININWKKKPAAPALIHNP